MRSKEFASATRELQKYRAVARLAACAGYFFEEDVRNALGFVSLKREFSFFTL
jgi:hypothetical protein